MTSDFLLLQKIRNGNNHAGNQFVEKLLFFYHINIAFCTSTIKNVQKIWYKKLL